MRLVKTIIVTILVALSGIMPVFSQDFGMYQSSEASITYRERTKNTNEKLPGTIITLEDYSHQLEIKSVLLIRNYLPLDNFTDYEPYIIFDLKMRVVPNKMQRYLTSEKIFTGYGILKLNNISKPVLVQYTPWPENTENLGQMNISLLVNFNLSDFFPYDHKDESITFLINNGYVNRYQHIF